MIITSDNVQEIVLDNSNLSTDILSNLIPTPGTNIHKGLDITLMPTINYAVGSKIVQLLDLIARGLPDYRQYEIGTAIDSTITDKYILDIKDRLLNVGY